MSERSFRRIGGSRAGLVAVVGAVAVACAIPLAGAAFAETSAAASTDPTVKSTGPTAESVDPASAEGRTITVSGTVTEADTGTPLAGICVGPFRWYDASECASDEVSDSSGRYKRALVVPAFAGTEGQVWAQPAVGDAYHLEVAAPLPLTDASEYVVDLSVPRAGKLSGRALNAVGKPLDGVCPQARGLDPEVYIGVPTATCSDAEGVWELARVPLTEVAVALMGDKKHQASYVPKGSLLANAARFTPEADRTLVVRDTKLVQGGTITVTASSAGRGANAIVLHPITTTQDLRVDTVMSAEVSEDGESPTISNVQAGSYTVEVRNAWDNLDCTDDVAVCSDLAPWWAPGTFDPGKAKAVKVVAATTTSLRAGMKKYRKLRLKLDSKLDKRNLGVEVFFSSGVEWESGDLDHLPPAAVKLRYSLDEGPGKRKQWWQGGKGSADAVIIGEDDDNIDVVDPDDPEPTKTTKTTKIKTTKTKATKVKTKKN